MGHDAHIPERTNSQTLMFWLIPRVLVYTHKSVLAFRNYAE
jgi:hypothetical protein